MNSRSALTQLDTFSRKKHPFTGLNPFSFFLITMSYIVLLSSFGKYDFEGQFALIIYPFFLLVFGGFSIRTLGKLLLPVLIFVFFIVLPNIYYDRETATLFSSFTIRKGTLSALTITLRAIMGASSILLFIAYKGILGLAQSLRAFRVPEEIISLFIFTYRYIQVLLKEAKNITLAYSQRSGKSKIAPHYWGPLIGQWFIRSIKRADNIHKAMELRGGDGPLFNSTKEHFKLFDYLWCIIWGVFFLIIKLRINYGFI